MLECDGKSKLIYTWEDGESDQPSLVSWNLTPDGDGTKLTLDHSELAASEPYVLIENGMNWGHATLSLGSHLSGFGYPPVPIVYSVDDPIYPVLERAGFRQPTKEEATCLA